MWGILNVRAVWRGVVGGMFVALLAACSWTHVENTNQQAQSTTGPSNPQASPSPTAECALGNIVPGTERDTGEIRPGQTLAIGVSLFGAQGLPLVQSCLDLYTPVWRAESGPCLWAGSHDGSATAPASATVGSQCVGGVDVAGKHGRLELNVVAP